MNIAGLGIVFNRGRTLQALEKALEEGWVLPRDGAYAVSEDILKDKSALKEMRRADCRRRGAGLPRCHRKVHRERRLCRIEFRVRTPLSLPAVPVVPPAVVMVMPPDLRHRAMVGRDPRRKRRDGGCLRNSGHGRKNQSCDRDRKCHSNHAVLLGDEPMLETNQCSPNT